MRVLLIGNSNDSARRFDEGKRRDEVALELLTAELGEAPEFVVKGWWPNERAPEVVGRWIDETDPDLIYLHVGTYPFQYRSVPHRFRRLFRRVGGEAVAGVAESAAKKPNISHNWAFRAGRRMLQRTIGGDTNFTREHVWRITEACIRTAIRKEGAIVVVKGPHGRNNYSFSKRQFRNDERERVRLHGDLAELCRQLHVTYDGIGEGGVFNDFGYQSGTTIGDGIHGNAVRHQVEGEVTFRAIIAGLRDAGRLSDEAEPAANVPG